MLLYFFRQECSCFNLKYVVYNLWYIYIHTCSRKFCSLNSLRFTYLKKVQLHESPDVPYDILSDRPQSRQAVLTDSDGCSQLKDICS